MTRCVQLRVVHDFLLGSTNNCDSDVIAVGSGAVTSCVLEQLFQHNLQEWVNADYTFRGARQSFNSKLMYFLMNVGKPSFARMLLGNL